MRKVIAMGAVILLAGSVNLAVAQERLPQHSGFGTGVGESAGTGTRSQVWDRADLLERLDQPEVIMGRIFAIDLAQNRLMLETGGVASDDSAGGRAGYGTPTVMTLYISPASNITQIRALNVGDEVTIQAREETTEAQPFGTGHKIALTVTVLRGEETQAGFGGLGQRPDPETERGIVTANDSSHGGVINSVLPGSISTGITTEVGEYTGTAPCWQCAPQPGFEDNGQYESDYGITDPNSAPKQNMKK